MGAVTRVELNTPTDPLLPSLAELGVAENECSLVIRLATDLPSSPPSGIEDAKILYGSAKLAGDALMEPGRSAGFTAGLRGLVAMMRRWSARADFWHSASKLKIVSLSGMRENRRESLGIWRVSRCCAILATSAARHTR